jgi:hypothetical protein
MNDSNILPPGVRDKSVRKNMKLMDEHSKLMNEHALETYREYRNRVVGDESDLLRGVSVLRSRSGELPVVVISEDRLMSAKEESAVLKTSFSSKQLNMLHICNSRKLGLENTSFEIRVGNRRGRIIAILLRNMLTKADSLQNKLLLECHDSESKWWTKGCEADTRPTAESIISNLRDANVMHSSGFTKSNVSKIEHVGPLKSDGSGRSVLVYTNKKGISITRPMCTALNRHKWPSKGINSLSHTANKFDPNCELTLVSRVRALYHSIVRRYLCSNDFERHVIDECMTGLDDSLTLSTLKLTCNNQIAVHRDPPTPMPACAFGMTTNIYDENSGEWKKRGKGGQLYLMNGLFSLDYSPTDVVFWDGNLAHGVTSIVRVQEGPQHVRFSALLFSTWRRERGMKKPGKYDGTGKSINKRSRRALYKYVMR